MIFGIRTDIVEVSRFEKWADAPELTGRFFNEKELPVGGTLSAKSRHLAVRFAAKEAFSKALGTGVRGFSLNDVEILNDELGKPTVILYNNLLNHAEDLKIQISISHSREYAVSTVIIYKE